MERTKLGPVEQFRDDSDACHVGRRVLDRGRVITAGAHRGLVVFRLYDTGEIVLVDPARLEPNVPNPPLPAESQSWHDMMDELAKMPEHRE